MIRFLLRCLLAVVGGLVAAFVMVMVVEIVTLAFHPFPPDLDTSDHDQIAAHVARFPAWVLVVAMIGWSLTMFLGVTVAVLLSPSRHPAAGWIIGLFLLAAASFNMFLLPYPGWFKIGTTIALPLMMFLALKTTRQKS